MKIAVLRFPGSNCDVDALKAARELGAEAEYVWHTETSLEGFDGVFVPGGFSFGDYLRCGAIAARSPVMEEVRRLAQRGNPIVGACNGFQVLCESGLLPGALVRNEREKFVCKWLDLQPEGASKWNPGRSIRLPIAHGEGRYVISDDEKKRLEDRGGVAFRYIPAADGRNSNGSIDHIAGVTNEVGNVLGLMPHPERAMRPELGGTDGRLVLRALVGG